MVSFVLGLAVMVGALIGVVLVLTTVLSAGSVPNALEGTTFCCDSPSTWGGVPVNIGIAILVVVGDAVLWVVAFWLFTAHVRWHWLLQAPAGGLILTLPVIAVLLAVNARDAVVLPDCDDFVLDPSAFVSGGEHGRRAQSLGVDRCEVLRGKSTAQVRSLLGDPDEGDRGASTVWRYGQLELTFSGGRVTAEELYADPGFDMS